MGGVGFLYCLSKWWYLLTYRSYKVQSTIVTVQVTILNDLTLLKYIRSMSQATWKDWGLPPIYIVLYNRFFVSAVKVKTGLWNTTRNTNHWLLHLEWCFVSIEASSWTTVNMEDPNFYIQLFCLAFLPGTLSTILCGTLVNALILTASQSIWNKHLFIENSILAMGDT